MGDFVGVNEDFSHFSTSLSANSLLVHGTLLRQNKSTLGPGKTERALLRRNQRKKKLFTSGPCGPAATAENNWNCTIIKKLRQRSYILGSSQSYGRLFLLEKVTSNSNEQVSA